MEPEQRTKKCPVPQLEDNLTPCGLCSTLRGIHEETLRMDRDQRLVEVALKEAKRMTQSVDAFAYWYSPQEGNTPWKTWSFGEQTPMNTQATQYGLADLNENWAEPGKSRKPMLVNKCETDESHETVTQRHPPIRRMVSYAGGIGDQITVLFVVTNKKEDYDERDTNRIVVIVESLVRALDRQRIAHALEESEAEHNRVLQALPNAVFVTQNGRISFCNPKAMALLQKRTKEEILGEELADFFSGVGSQAIKQILESTEQTEGNTREVLVHIGESENRVLEINTAPIMRQGRQSLVVIMRDITSQQQIEEALQHSQKLETMGTLASGVAHDFNNILTVISAHVEMLSRRIKTLPGVAESLDQLGQATTNAKNLTQQLLLFSRRKQTNFVLCNINDCLHNGYKMWRRLVDERIEIQINTDQTAAGVIADGGMLDQVIMNLIVNARDAIGMKRRGNILIQTRSLLIEEPPISKKTGPYTVIEVTDNGGGIPPQIQQQIFEPFFTTKPAGKGTGLGLATVQSIIDQHGGWIELESQIDIGTTFKIFLPCVDKEMGELTVLEEDEDVVRGSGTIMIIEDDELARWATQDILADAGYDIISSSNTDEAFQEWSMQFHEIDAILCDLQVPGQMTTKELIEVFRKQCPEMPIVLMTGYIHAHEWVENETVVQKPYSGHQLTATLKQKIEASKISDEQPKHTTNVG